MRHFHCALSGLLLIVSSSTAALGASANPYLETVLTTSGGAGGGTNVPSAPNTDPNLLNPWGFGFTATSPFWTGDQALGVSTLYAASGAPNNTVGPVTVTSVPPANTNVGPTGVVANINTNPTSYIVNGTSSPASFIFDTLNGTIAAWNGGAGGIGNHGTAAIEVTTPGAIYTGLAQATLNGQDLIYAADNASGSGHSTIAVFGGNWLPFTGLTGNFVDPNLPAGTAPFNIQLLNGQLYVTYASGSIGVFDLNGNFIRGVTDTAHLITAWGLALAPATFGQFGGDLLVGDRASGQINAYAPDPTNPMLLDFQGTLLNSNGQPLAIPGLWAIAFRASGTTFDPNALYFDAGVNSKGGNFYTDGIFGEITSVPEPSSAILLGLGVTVLCGVCNWNRQRRQRKDVPALAGADDSR